MLEIGKYNTLNVERETSSGYYLSDNEGNEVLLPFNSADESVVVDKEAKVFIYKDSEDRFIATCAEPYIFINEFAVLEAVTVNNIGAFFNWGIEGKDLFVPYSEQSKELTEGELYLVYLYEDKKTNRLVGSTKKNRYLELDRVTLNIGEKVNILVYEETKLGFNVIVNDKYQGLLYKNEVFEAVAIEDYVEAYVKKIRPDKKIDISLYKIGFEAIADHTQKLYSTLKKNNNTLQLNDKSDPKDIAAQLGMSKKVFKKSVGALYRMKVLTFTETGIELIGSVEEYEK